MLLCVPLLNACGIGGAPPPVVRDSSGVAIIENFGPSWSRGERWTVSPEPTIDIGGQTADADHQLTRPESAVRLADGTIVVANSGKQELRWYDPLGRFMRQAGEPGQFARLEWVQRFGDAAVLAFDFGNIRASVFDTAGALTQQVAFILTYGTAPGSVRGVFSDSTLLLVRDTRYWAPETLRSGAVREGLFRGWATVARYALDGSLINNLGSFPESEQVVHRGSGGVVRLVGRPFGRTATFTVHRDRLFAATQDTYEIEVYDSEGTQTTVVRLEHENEPVEDDQVDRYKRSRLAGVHERERANKEMELNALPFPLTMPAHGRIIADEDGNLWVEDYRPFNAGTPRWSVFDPEYRMLGTVEFPADVRVHQIGTDFVLGGYRDSAGADHIRVHTLVRP
jgi:hypothetical protein